MFSLRSIFSLIVLFTVACGGEGAAPELQPVPDRVVAVNEEIVILLSASDANGDELFYRFVSEAPDIYRRATLRLLPTGAAEFRWTPNAADLGTWYFDFIVTDGSHTDVSTSRIEVKSAVGDASAPRFLRPQGSGTTLDLDASDCLEIDIEVFDADSATVRIDEEAPRLEGAELVQESGLEARWRWCPSAAQAAADDRYTLTLSADDGDNPKTIHSYLVVLRRAPAKDCPGLPPTIDHTPEDQSILVGLTIDARVSDDQGLKKEPLLYYSETQPSTPPDLSAMMQTTMILIDGTPQDGTWAADVPNPVAGKPPGTVETLHYVIVAQDDDDATGDCDHLSQAPTSGAFSVEITHPGGLGGAPLCAPCSADLQCGGAADLCAVVGTEGVSSCLSGCSKAGDCPIFYHCSAAALSSVDGASARQCVPDSESCSGDPGTASCSDDDFEDNDNAVAATALAEGSHVLKSCPALFGGGDDEDWFEIDLMDDADLSLLLAGGSGSDLDLALYDAADQLVASSSSFSSSESIHLCAASGTYLVRVFAFGSAENTYTLAYQASATTCALP